MRLEASLDAYLRLRNMKMHAMLNAPMTKMVDSGIMGRKPNMPMPMPIPNGEKPKGFIKLWPMPMPRPARNPPTPPPWWW